MVLHMAPIADPAPATKPLAVTRPVVRARRRGPMPLEQIPAWRELVPVMDPAVIGRTELPRAGWRPCSAASMPTSSAR